MIRTYAALVAAALLLLPVVATLGPSNVGWGLDALAFLPAWWRVTFGVVAAAGVVAALALGRERGGADSAAEVPAAGRSGGTLALPLVGGALVLGTLFFIARARTALLGRGYDLLLDLGQGEPPSPVSPLYNVVAPGFVRLQREAGFPTVSEVGLLSVLVGLVVVGLGALLLHREGRGAPERASGTALVAVLLATQGAMAVFFGVVEASPLFVGAVLLFLLLARSTVQGGGGLAGPALLAALAVAAHPFGWALAPALVVTAALKPGPGRGRRAALVSVGVLVVAGGLTLAAAGDTDGGFLAGLAPRQLGEFRHLLARAAFDTDESPRLLSVVSPRHAADVANHLAVTAFPALLLIAVLAFRSEGRRALVAPSALVALSAFLPLLAVRIGMRTPFGPMRDWDHFAGAGVALTAWAAFAAAPLVAAMGRRGRAVTALALLCGVLALAPQVGVSANAGLSVDRHIARVEGRPALEAPVISTFHAAMGQRFLSMSRTDLAGNALERAWTAWPTAATAWRAGLAFLAAGRLEKAAAAMTEVTTSRPEDWRGWAELGNAWCGLGRFDRADPALQRAIALGPEAAAPRIYLARSLALQGRPDAARAQLEAARSRLEPLDPLRPDFDLLDDQLPPGFTPSPR